ncbi:hypothetical protein ACI68E_000002 [Malassezia pachydermatis]|uniref:Uncharacterized protein n=1 Tax=Malassezia pachydermatis TaxID=77020 RepID=A0A0M9VMY1_9BASI|nr:hypothetical protein Malapachy_1328 [Malassezia pachydermatis]KOS12725.1 hypothetical protein Malapachy_1328 [Malassezia pachydermatis]
MTVMAGTPHGKVLDRRLSCQQAIENASSQCQDFLHGLGVCLQEIGHTGQPCWTAYGQYVSSFDQCFMDFVNCFVPPGLQWG